MRFEHDVTHPFFRDESPCPTQDSWLVAFNIKLHDIDVTFADGVVELTGPDTDPNSRLVGEKACSLIGRELLSPGEPCLAGFIT